MDGFEQQSAITSPEQLDWESYRQQGLAATIDELPPLPEDHVRAVHITAPPLVDSILAGGLDYSRQGMLMSTARAWSDQEQVEYKSGDPRFGRGTVDIIFDLTAAESKLHNRMGAAPGIVTPDHIVGVIDPYRGTTAESGAS